MILLLPIGVLLLMFAVFMFMIHAWARALVDALDAKFVSAGVWTCVGIFMVNALNGGEWRDMRPLNVAVMIVAVGATITKHALRIRKA